MRHIRRVLGLGHPLAQPVTMDDVAPEEQSEERIAAQRVETNKLAVATVDARRTAWEVRRELASRAISLVSHPE